MAEIEIIKEMKSMLSRSKVPKMDNSHQLDTRKMEQLLLELYRQIKPSITTNEEFNEKYKDWLDEGHYGCDIGNEECIKWLDKVFEAFILVPEFRYQQIKWKFGKARFYADNCPVSTYLVEQKLNEIYETQRLS